MVLKKNLSKQHSFIFLLRVCVRLALLQQKYTATRGMQRSIGESGCLLLSPTFAKMKDICKKNVKNASSLLWGKPHPRSQMWNNEKCLHMAAHEATSGLCHADGEHLLGIHSAPGCPLCVLDTLHASCLNHRNSLQYTKLCRCGGLAQRCRVQVRAGWRHRAQVP